MSSARTVQAAILPGLVRRCADPSSRPPVRAVEGFAETVIIPPQARSDWLDRMIFNWKYAMRASATRRNTESAEA